MFNPASGATEEVAQQVTLPRKPAAGQGLDGNGLPRRRSTHPAMALTAPGVSRPVRPAAAEALDGKRATLAARPVEAPAPNTEQLLQQTTAARDTDEALEYAQRAAELNPDDPRVQATLQRALLAHLNRDAFVAFLAETPKTYVVNWRHPRPRVLPKTRAQPEVFPPAKRTPGDSDCHVAGPGG